MSNAAYNNKIVLVLKDGYRRRAGIQKLLRPLRPNVGPSKRDVVVVMRSQPDGIVMAACEKDERGRSHREMYFRTHAGAIWATYFEEWGLSPDQTACYLRQASLQFYFVERPREVPEEIWALHCEPHITDNSTKSLFKRGPHVHVTADRNKLAHAHLPLNLGHLDDVLESLETLTGALSSAVTVAQLEVVGAVLA